MKGRFRLSTAQNASQSIFDIKIRGSREDVGGVSSLQSLNDISISAVDTKHWRGVSFGVDDGASICRKEGIPYALKNGETIESM